MEDKDMQRRTLARGDLGMAVAAALVLGGCTGDTAHRPIRDDTPTRSASQELAEAATRVVQQDTYRMTMAVATGDYRSRLTGVADPEKDVGY